MKFKAETRVVFVVLFSALLLLLTAIHLLSPSAEFTGDDYYYVANNPLVTKPGISTLAEIWQRPMKIEYFPVTITSYALEYRLWGGSVRFYHLTNLLVFACIGFAAGALAIRLAESASPVNSIDQSQLSLIAATATIFMLFHPLNVESIASISNRKELLYVLFALLALLSYLSKKEKWVTVFGAVFFMALAQLSKGAAVVLPGIFLCCELLPAKRAEWLRNLYRPAVAALLAIIIFTVQFRVSLKAGVVEKSGTIDLLSRAGGIIRSFNIMISKFLLPVNLTYDYDFAWPHGLPPFYEWLLPSAVVVLLLVMVYRRSWGVLAITVMALLTLLPYSNIIPLRHNTSGQMVFYDHYLLFAIMLFPALLTTLLFSSGRRIQQTWLLGSVISVILLTGYNSYLFKFWQTRETLYRRIIQVTPNLPKGYLFLGKSLNETGRYQEAIEPLSKLVTLNNWIPTYLDAYRELGNAYAFSGHMPEAEKAYRSYLEYQPKDRASLQNLSAALIEQRKYEEARGVILLWLTSYPNDANARKNMQLCEQMLLQ